MIINIIVAQSPPTLPPFLTLSICLFLPSASLARKKCQRLHFLLSVKYWMDLWPAQRLAYIHTPLHTHTDLPGKSRITACTWTNPVNFCGNLIKTDSAYQQPTSNGHRQLSPAHLLAIFAACCAGFVASNVVRDAKHFRRPPIRDAQSRQL